VRTPTGRPVRELTSRERLPCTEPLIALSRNSWFMLKVS